MSAVKIYMEGGGSSSGSKAALRQGMDVFLQSLKLRVRKKRWKWKLVCCGSRNDAFKAFKRSCIGQQDATILLLVDSESPIKVNRSPRDHLIARDKWDLNGHDNEVVHLMVQSMETWIVADPDILAAFYGQGFRANVLPSRENLEHEKKSNISAALKRATQNTTKGEYHKIGPAMDLLKHVDSGKVRKRCPHCERLFDTLEQAIGRS